MKSPIRKFFGFAVFAICLAACASNRAASPAGVPPTVNPATFTAALPSPTATQTKLPPIRMTDGLGTEVSLPGPASRIVSLGPSNTEILFAIGAEDLIVGADLSSDYPEEAKSLASISASSYGTLDVESIKALEPDLVLAAEILSSDQVQGMRSLGLTVFYIANPTELPDGLYANIRAVGALTGRDAGAETLVSALRARFQAVAERIAGTSGNPLVFAELDGSDPARPWTCGQGAFVDMLITLAGGRNLAASLSSHWVQISAEEIFRLDPDIILLMDTAFGVTVESVAQRPGWVNLAAVRNGAVFAIDTNLVLRPGPRLIDGLEAIAAITHPEAFAQP